MSGKTYTIKQELVVRFAHALSNPTRVVMCEYISKHKNCSFGAIQEALPLSKATVSQHLKVLKDAGLVIGEEHLPRVNYYINEENWLLARQVLADFMNQCLGKVDLSQAAII